MKIFDPIHNFIVFDAIEEEVLQHPFMERLRHIYQLGPAFHIYPSATHSRFTHTLGVMHVATLIFDSVFPSYCFDEEQKYLRQLVRLGALLHDVGHFPLSHTAELFLFKHEKMVEKIFEEGIFDSIFLKVATLFGKNFNQTKRLVKSIALGESNIPNYLSQIIADPLFGADRIDYLLRDAMFTGLSYGNIDLHQLIQSIYLDSDQTLKIHPQATPSCEALLMARYWMHERVYQHPKVRALVYHYAFVIKEVLIKNDALNDLDVFCKIDDHTIFCALQDYKEHHEAIFDPQKRVQVQKLPLKELKNITQTQSKDDSMMIDIPLKQKGHLFEGTRIRIEEEDYFWVYKRN